MALRFAFVTIFFGLCATEFGLAAPASLGNGECGPNAFFLKCGSACVRSCAQRVLPAKYACTQQCVVGCFCKPGFLKNDKHECVRDHECEPEHKTSMQEPESTFLCPVGEQFSTCGSSCANSCGSRTPSEIMCNKACEIGCFCKKGYLRNAKGNCVPEARCNADDDDIGTMPVPKCGRNEVFNKCGSSCPATCSDPNPPSCKCDCVAGCFCEVGHLRDESGVCVPKTKCSVQKQPSRKCDSDREIYHECGSVLECTARCDLPAALLLRGEPTVPEKCKRFECQPACYCKTPYLRNADGRCVVANDCDKITKPYFPDH